MKNNRLVIMIEVAIMAAVALILDLLVGFKLGATGSISIAMVPIFILAFRWGWKASAAGGFLWGLLQIVVGDLQALTFWQVILEYFLAFACIGFAGFFLPLVQKTLKNGDKTKMFVYVTIATFVGSFARYFWHFLAGATIWAKYAPEGQSPFLYSLIYNGTPFLGASILCSIVLGFLLVTAPRLILDHPSNRASQPRMNVNK